jgi:hypothetical protein
MKKRIFHEIKTSELYRLLERYIEKKYEGCNVINIVSISNRASATGIPLKEFGVRATVDVPVTDETELSELKGAEVIANTDYAKPTIDDSVILVGTNQVGRSITRRYGHVFKIAQSTKEYWIIKPVKKTQQGKFGGTAKDTDLKKAVFKLEKNENDITRNFKIAAVCRFPNHFKDKDFLDDLIVMEEIRNEENDSG